jgi:hypothetical protein
VTGFMVQTYISRRYGAGDNSASRHYSIRGVVGDLRSLLDAAHWSHHLGVELF